MSIRKIAKETDIGFWFIQPVIHKFKNQVKMSYIKSNQDKILFNKTKNKNGLSKYFL